MVPLLRGEVEVEDFWLLLRLDAEPARMEEERAGVVVVVPTLLLLPVR